MTPDEQHRALLKELWSAIEDYKVDSCDHRQVQIALDRLLEAECLVTQLRSGEEALAMVPDALDDLL